LELTAELDSRQTSQLETGEPVGEVLELIDDQALASAWCVGTVKEMP
jgi:hypothetical protein